MQLICDYYEDAKIYLDLDNKERFNGIPYITITLYNLIDFLQLDTMKWTLSTLNQDWSDEIYEWAKAIKAVITDMWYGKSEVQLLDEEW